jgi:hypothetical protein
LERPCDWPNQSQFKASEGWDRITSSSPPRQERCGAPDEIRPKRRTHFVPLLTIRHEIWTDDHLDFRVSELGPVVSTVYVFDNYVNLQVALFRPLAKLAEAVQPLIRQEGTLMLEK